jgi:hypothetical protein
MTRKLLAFLLPFVMLAGLAACSDDESADLRTREQDDVPADDDEDEGKTDDTEDEGKDPDDDPGKDRTGVAQAALDKLQEHIEDEATTDDLSTVLADLTGEEEVCVVSGLVDRPDLLDSLVADDAAAMDPEHLSVLLELMMGCASDETLDALAADMSADMGIEVGPEVVECLVEEMLDQPELLAALAAGEEPDPGVDAQAVPAMLGCIPRDVLIDGLAASLGEEASPEVTEEQLRCVAVRIIDDPDLLASTVQSSMAGEEIGSEQVQAMLGIMVDCGVPLG